jgi:hypothetical protein
LQVSVGLRGHFHDVSRARLLHAGDIDAQELQIDLGMGLAVPDRLREGGGVDGEAKRLDVATEQLDEIELDAEHMPPSFCRTGRAAP